MLIRLLCALPDGPLRRALRRRVYRCVAQRLLEWQINCLHDGEPDV
jgi:hypothetical protein